MYLLEARTSVGDLITKLQNMNYLKINFLYVMKIIILGILFFALNYLNNHLTELYKTELNKNLQFEEKFTEKNSFKKSELENINKEKENDFRNYLHYSLLTTLLGIVIISLINGKIDSENKKLDELEKEI